MSLATTLTALQDARGAIVDAIGSKGVIVASSATLLSCASAIGSISTGTDVSSTTAKAADVLSGKVFYNSGGSLTSGTIPTVSASLAANVATIPAGYIAASQSLTVPEAGAITTSGNIVTVPVGYIASSRTVSAGTNVSSTTAEASHVLSGKIFYNSSGVQTSGNIPTVSAAINNGSVIVPVGYIAVSQSFSVSSGIDVSNTTAEAENVQSGYYFYNSAGVKTEGTLTVSGGIDVSDTTATAAMVLSGAIFHDSTGAVTTGMIPTVSAAVVSGAVVVPSGYIPSSQSFPVSSGVDITLGYINSAHNFQGLGFDGTSAYDSGSPDSSTDFYTWHASGGEQASGVVIISGTDVISSAATMSSKNLLNGETMLIRSGGTASDCNIRYNGNMHISSGGTAILTVVSGVSGMPAVMVVTNGGIVTGSVSDNEGWYFTAIKDFGYMYVSSGGEVKGVDVFGGYIEVASGGKVCMFDISSGGTIVGYSGAYVGSGGHSDVGYFAGISYVNDGDLFVSGALTSFVDVGSSGRVHVGNSGRVERISVGSGGSMYIEATGIAESCTIYNGGTLVVSSGGYVLSCTIESGGTLVVSSGGYAQNISSGYWGTIIVSSGGYITYAQGE